ncbi:MAG: flagellar hook-associated protein FlgK [Lachnospiraceae bacterium]|nr:flagellar hook-associated protein FlgK [Lachnospiraceae bacterium]
MSSLYVGTSGLQTSQNALNTTAHNLSNIETVGYTRQQVQQSDKRYVTLSRTASAVSYQQAGLGVDYSRAKQVRDYFLDKTYRKESGRSAFYEISSTVMEEVESQLGELNGKAFQTTMADFWTSIQELAKDPSSSVTQGLLVQRAAEFLDRGSAVYEGLCSYQDNLNLQVKQQVDKINDYGNQLLDINDRIRSIESGNIERANDLRDTRNQILDELAQLTDITFSEDYFGNIDVQIEGVDFVKGGMCYEIGLDEDPVTGFYTAFWPQNASYITDDNGKKIYTIDGAEVFDFNVEISSDYNTDVGRLKGMLLARGDHRADYTDAQGDNYSKVEQSVIMNVQAEFDQLMHNVVSKINDIFADAAGRQQGDLEIVNEDGSVETLSNAKYIVSSPNGYMCSEEGYPIRMFDKITSEPYRQVTGTDGNTYWVYNEEQADLKESLYTLRNLQINQDLMQRPSSLGLRLEDGSEDQATAAALKEAFNEEIYTLNPKVQKRVTFNDYYSDLVSQVANSGYVYRSIYESQQNTVESVEGARAQVIGVSSDEELSNMIKFQNAFNASSRYINAISEMLEHIITSMGH